MLELLERPIVIGVIVDLVQSAAVLTVMGVLIYAMYLLRTGAIDRFTEISNQQERIIFRLEALEQRFEKIEALRGNSGREPR